MNYSDLEDVLVEKLQPVAESIGVDVVAIPQNQKEFIKPFERARITINWEISDFVGNRGGAKIATASFDKSVQEGEIEITFLIQSRKLRGEDGSYAVIDMVVKELTGFVPLNMAPLKLKSIKPTNFDENLWTHTVSMGTTETVISKYDNNNDPDLNDLTFLDNFE